MAKATVIDIPDDHESKFLRAAEEVAMDGLKAMKAYLNYQGTQNKEYLNHAKIGAAAVQGYTRHYASLTNHEALKLTARRQTRELPSGD